MNTADLTAINSGKLDSSNSTWRDWLGITASIGCAIHCAAMPFVIAYLPALGLSFLADESFHKWMALACFLIAIAAFVPGFRKHRNWLPLSIGVVGLGLITFAAFGLAGECCASCSSGNGSHASLVADSANESDSDCEHCEHCEDCQGQVAAGNADDQSAVAATVPNETESSLLSTLAPWLTPFGGVLLVSAHLINRRLGCLCGCC